MKSSTPSLLTSPADDTLQTRFGHRRIAGDDEAFAAGEERNVDVEPSGSALSENDDTSRHCSSRGQTWCRGADDQVIEPITVYVSSRGNTATEGPRLVAGGIREALRGLRTGVAALAIALGDVHRGVGVADQLVGVRRGRRRRRSEMPRLRGRTAPSLQPQRRGERLEDPLGGIGGVLRAAARPRAGRRTRRRRSAPRCRSGGCWRPGAWRPRAAPRRRRRGRGCR